MPLPVYHHAVEAIAAAFPAAAWWGGAGFEKSLTQKQVRVKTWAEEAGYFGQEPKEMTKEPKAQTTK